MTEHRPEHEKLFDEISHKLNELSLREEIVQPQQQKLERMQIQMKKFHSELQGSQDELKQKIRSLENVHVAQTELNQQLKAISDQLQQERMINNKLNADLAKSLEISLQLQLEIQGLKARSQQSQNEEKKYSHSLLEKLKFIQNELELSNALKEELSIELAKAKSSYQRESEQWQKENAELTQLTRDNQFTIEKMGQEIESLSHSLGDIEDSAMDQNDAMKNLMTVAENKIVELKMAFDKKNIESQDYYNHLQQALTQASLSKQENLSLKDYIQKVNIFLQQQQTKNTSNDLTTSRPS